MQNKYKIKFKGNVTFKSNLNKNYKDNLNYN